MCLSCWRREEVVTRRVTDVVKVVCVVCTVSKLVAGGLFKDMVRAL